MPAAVPARRRFFSATRRPVASLRPSHVFLGDGHRGGLRGDPGGAGGGGGLSALPPAVPAGLPAILDVDAAGVVAGDPDSWKIAGGAAQVGTWACWWRGLELQSRAPGPGTTGAGADGWCIYCWRGLGVQRWRGAGPGGPINARAEPGAAGQCGGTGAAGALACATAA